MDRTALGSPADGTTPADHTVPGVVVRSLRPRRSIGEYVRAILERRVPDHRAIQAVETDEA